MSFTGSSKSMEPDMVVEMVGRTLKKGVRMEGRVGMMTQLQSQESTKN